VRNAAGLRGGPQSTPLSEWVPTGKARGTHFVVLRSLDSFHSLGIVVSEAEPRLGFASLRTTLSKGPRPKAVARVEGSRGRAHGSGRLAPLAACWCLSLLTGCAALPLRTPVRAPNPLPEAVAAYYSYPPSPREATLHLIQEHRAFRELLVRFPLSASGLEPTEPVVELEWFESRAPGRRAAIVFNPILGGDYPLERGLCRFFAAHGFHVALVHRRTIKLSPEHEVAHLELLLRQGVLRIRQVVDWMAQQERVDPERLGSFGISMGGIAGVIAAAVEPRLRAHVVALAGGSIPDVLLTSHDRLLTRLRARYLVHRRMEPARLYELLQQHITTDPIRLAPAVDPGQFLMIIALADRTIGRANAFRLWRAVGRPRAVFLPLGHYTAYLALPYVKRVSLRFFRERLSACPEPSRFL
jgi:hypothetical protein